MLELVGLKRSSLLMFLRFFMVCEIARFSYNDATVCILIHWQPSEPYESYLPFTPVLTTRMIRALLRRHCRILPRRRRPSPRAEPVWYLQHTEWIICVTSGNVCTVQTFPVITQKTYFESSIPKILLTSQRWRRSNIAFFTNTWQMCCRLNWNGNIFLQRKLFQRKNAKKESKGQTNS